MTRKIYLILSYLNLDQLISIHTWTSKILHLGFSNTMFALYLGLLQCKNPGSTEMLMLVYQLGEYRGTTGPLSLQHKRKRHQTSLCSHVVPHSSFCSFSFLCTHFVSLQSFCVAIYLMVTTLWEFLVILCLSVELLD